MPITEHYKGKSWDVPIERPTLRPVFKRADGTMWMVTRPDQFSLPQWIEGMAKGWITYQFVPPTLTMQVLGCNPAIENVPANHRYYYTGDREKRPIDRSIKPPAAQT